MRARLAAIVLAVALALAGAGAAAPASGGAAKRPASAGTKQTCMKHARTSCRRVRASAGMRRGAGRGRALLAPRSTRRVPPSTGALSPAPRVPGGVPAPPAVDPPAPDPTAPAPVASTIGAEAYDFGSFVLRLTKPSVPAGSLTIYFRNYDVSDHNLWVQPPATVGPPMRISDAVGEGGGATTTVAVTPGTWRFYCSLLGHEVMTRDLTVQ